MVFAPWWCEARGCSVLINNDMFVCRVVSSYTLDDIHPGWLSDQQQVRDDGYRYLLRATMGWSRGISIGIEINYRTRAPAPIVQPIVRPIGL